MGHIKLKYIENIITVIEITASINKVIQIPACIITVNEMKCIYVNNIRDMQLKI